MRRNQYMPGWLGRFKRGRLPSTPLYRDNSDNRAEELLNMDQQITETDDERYSEGKRRQLPPSSQESTAPKSDEHSESSASQESVHTSKSPSSGPATPMVAAIGGIPKPYIIAELDAETGEVFFIIASEGRPPTSVSEKASGESGEGNHVTPYSAFLQIVYSAVEDADPKDIPGMIEQMSNIFLKKDAAPVDLTTGTDLCQDFEKKLSKMRAKRKTISQRIRRMELSKPEGEGGYKGTISSDKVRKHCQVEESMNFIADNYHELCDPLKNEEKLLIAKFVAARAQEFISNLNLEDDVSFSKGRVKDKRAEKESNLRQKMQSYKIDGLPVAAGNIEDKIRVVKAHITRKRDQDRTADEAVTLKDIAYHDRIRGEGTRVNMALKGLRALNELIRAKNELEAIGEDGSLSEEDKQKGKRHLINGLLSSSDVTSGLRGTELNPTFGTQDINSIINGGGTDLSISNDQLKELSHKAGYLFARLFDYEMVEYDSGSLVEDRSMLKDDLRALYRLSTRHLSFMCCAFKHLTTLSSENRLEAVKSFSSAVLEEQDWGEVVMESGEALDESTLVDKIRSNKDFDVSSLFPHMKRSSGQCIVM